MPVKAQIETTQAIQTQTVSTTLKKKLLLVKTSGNEIKKLRDVTRKAICNINLTGSQTGNKNF